MIQDLEAGRPRGRSRSPPRGEAPADRAAEDFLISPLGDGGGEGVQARSLSSELGIREGWSGVVSSEGGDFAASRGGEINLKRLTPAEREKFILSDSKEWKAMLGTGAVE
eukprot:3199969-Pyramimonas_sp.AAC.1